MNITHGERVIILPPRLSAYANDVEQFFDCYWSAHDADSDVLDFTEPRDWALHGWRWPVRLPAFTEPIGDLRRYVDHANLEPGGVAVDGGSYAGLVAMMLHDAVGESGAVVTVEPDPINHAAAAVNIGRYWKEAGYGPVLLASALSDTVGSALLTMDGGMGSTLHGPARNVQQEVSTLTLSALNLPHVDYVKLDVEGAEVSVLSDAAFFADHHPRLSIEVHPHTSTLSAVEGLLGTYGYTWQTVEQPGSPFPLVEAW